MLPLLFLVPEIAIIVFFSFFCHLPDSCNIYIYIYIYIY